MKQRVITALVALLLWCVASTFGAARSQAEQNQFNDFPDLEYDYGGNEPSTYHGFLECGLRKFSGETRTHYCCTIPYYNLFPGIPQAWAAESCAPVTDIRDSRVVRYCCALPGDDPGTPPPEATSPAPPPRAHRDFVVPIARPGWLVFKSLQ